MRCIASLWARAAYSKRLGITSGAKGQSMYGLRRLDWWRMMVVAPGSLCRSSGVFGIQVPYGMWSEWQYHSAY